jgi:hypothetical protein
MSGSEDDCPWKHFHKVSPPKQGSKLQVCSLKCMLWIGNKTIKHSIETVGTQFYIVIV